MYKRILVPLDGSTLAECVLPHIISVARPEITKVELFSVIEPVNLPSRGRIALSEEDIKHFDSDLKKEVHDYLEKVSARLKKSSINVNTVVISGKVAESIVDYAVTNKFDLIIMATHGRSGLNRWLMGSVAEKVIHAVELPILLIKARTNTLED